MKMKLDRRSFLKITGAALAATAAGCNLGKLERHPTDKYDKTWKDRRESFAISVCESCAAGCGLTARVVDGCVVGIRGNPGNPINRKGLCPRAVVAPQALYSPDRLRTPIKAAGGRGSGRWHEVTWEAALAEIGERLGALRGAGEPHALAVLTQPGGSVTDLLWERFARAFGTPNLIRFDAQSDRHAPIAVQLAQGIEQPIAYDIGNANVILSFGCELLDGWRSPVFQQREFGRLHRKGSTRGRYVHIGHGFSTSAAKADTWVALATNTEATFALGLANVIIREGLYDKSFVSEYCHGFDDWVDDAGKRHEGFAAMVLRDYHPREVARTTGIPVETIIDLARDFALHQPSVAIGEKETAYGPNDIYTRLAIHSLNALAGNIGRPGGVLVQSRPPVALPPGPAGDATAAAGLARPRIDGAGEGAYLLARDAVQALPLNVISRRPYALKAAIIHGVNPLYGQAGRDEYAGALAQVPFVVAINGFLDETADAADIVLPEAHALEKWQGSFVTTLPGYSLFVVGGPAVQPRHKARNGSDCVLGIAQAVSGPVAAAMPWKDGQAVIRALAQQLYESKSGYVMATREKEDLRKALLEQGLWEPEFDSFEAFWTELVRQGGWYDPSANLRDAGRHFPTRSGKYEFHVQTLRSMVAKAGGDTLFAAMGVKAAGDLRYLPHQEPGSVAADQAEFALLLNVYRLPTLGGRDSADLPLLQERPSVRVRKAHWTTWIEMNPGTARKLGIHEGDAVWVESRRGRIRTVAYLDAGVRADTINAPVGNGRSSADRRSRKNSGNPLDLVRAGADSLLGIGVLNQTRVKVYRG